MFFWVSVEERLQQSHFDEWDEYLAGERAQEMHTGGIWVVPYFNGSPDLAKPPLQYSLTARLLDLGVDPVLSARLLSLLYAGLMAVLFVALARAVRKPRSDLAVFYWAAPWFLLGLPLVRYHASSAFLDLGQTFFFVAIVAAINRAPERPRWWIFAGLLAGFGTWQKTPLTLAVFALAAIIVVLVDGRIERRREAGAWAFCGGLVALAMTAMLPCLFALNAEVTWAAIAETFRHEISGRVRMETGFEVASLRSLWLGIGILGVPMLFAGVPLLRNGWRQRDSLRLNLFLIGTLFLVSLFWYSKINHRYVVPFAVFGALWLLVASIDSATDHRRWLRWGFPALLGACFLGLNLVTRHADFYPVHREHFVVNSEVVPEMDALLEQEGAAIPRVVFAFSIYPDDWALIHPAVILFHSRHIAEESSLMWLPLHDPNVRRGFYPRTLYGFCHVNDFAAVQALFPEAEELLRHEHILVWRR